MKQVLKTGNQAQGTGLPRMRRWLLAGGMGGLALAGIFALVSWPSSGHAWFFFIAKNGLRQQWVFSSGCNPSARPIKVTYDTDDPSNGSITYWKIIKGIHDEWNQQSASPLNLMTQITTNGANIEYQEMSVSAVNAYLQNPVAGTIRVVYDSNGDVLRNLGIDPQNILGIGLPLAMDSNRPNEICSGLMILNGSLLNNLGPVYYRYTLLHELGHVLGFAHSIAGDNGSAGLVDASTSDYIPVMHPFAPNPPSLSKTLTDDEKAGLNSVYGP